MRYIFIMALFYLTHVGTAQRQKEITDFVEKWRLEGITMKKLSISGLPGRVEITGNSLGVVDIKVEGKDVYLLNGGATGLGFILSKDKNDNYRIQGLSDQELDVFFKISVPDHAVLDMRFGPQVFGSPTWYVKDMKSDLRVEMYQGKMVLKDVSGLVSAVNHDGDVSIEYTTFDKEEPHIISALGKIDLTIPDDSKLVLELNLYKDLPISLDSEIVVPNLKKGTHVYESGNYTNTINGGETFLKLYAYGEPIRIHLKK